MINRFVFVLFLSFALHAQAETNPPEVVTKEFFHYLLSSKNDISTDSKAQGHWLAKPLRKLLASATEAANKSVKAHPDEKIDLPDNKTFLGAWDPPTSFEITKSQQTLSQALVTINCKWGPDTQYPGDKRVMTAVLTLENGSWKISDIQTHAGKFASEGTLVEELRQLKVQ